MKWIKNKADSTILYFKGNYFKGKNNAFAIDYDVGDLPLPLHY